MCAIRVNIHVPLNSMWVYLGEYSRIHALHAYGCIHMYSRSRYTRTNLARIICKKCTYYIHKVAYIIHTSRTHDIHIHISIYIHIHISHSSYTRKYLAHIICTNRTHCIHTLCTSYTQVAHMIHTHVYCAHDIHTSCTHIIRLFQIHVTCHV